VFYGLEFWGGPAGFEILHERLIDGDSESGGPNYFMRRGTSMQFGGPALELARVQAAATAMPSNESVFARFKNPMDTTPVTEVGRCFEEIRIFREFRTGFNSQARHGISTAAPKDSLSEGADNLALVLHQLDFLGAHDRIKEYLKRFCARFEDVKVDVGEGLARTFLREAGLSDMLSGIRMSDGTLKFLCLLAVLFHPKPAPLVCIEEPELGLHPDALRLVAEVLVEASERTQLIITTHSEALVDALSDHPESVLVCERDFDNGTQFKRLAQDELDEWLEHYTLGELWRKGELGGGRW
jgi:predicted ATPase